MTVSASLVLEKSVDSSGIVAGVPISIPWNVTDQTELAVYYNNGVLATLGTHYTVTLTPPDYLTAQVTPTSTLVALLDGTNPFVVKADMDFVQAYDASANKNLPERPLELTLDRMVLYCHQLLVELGKTFRTAPGVTLPDGFSFELPSPADVPANSLLYLNNDKTGLIFGTPVAFEGVIGVDVQAQSDLLDQLAGLEASAVSGRMLYTTGANVWDVAAITTAGRALLDDADAAAQRATLGLVIGTDVLGVSAIGSSVLAFSDALDSGARGTVIYFNMAGTPEQLAPGTAGQALLTGGAGADPSWGKPLSRPDFTSSALVSGASVTRTAAHGLGVVPSRVQLRLVNKGGASAEGGFDGHTIYCSSQLDTSAYGQTLYADATNVYLRTGTTGIAVVAISAATLVPITPASWDLYLDAWL